MSDDPRPKSLDRILTYEELDAAERLEVDRYLATRPQFAAQLQRLRDVEQAARQTIPVVTNDGFWSDHGLTTEDEAHCRESARRICEALADIDRSDRPAAPATPVSRRRFRLRTDPRWLLPVAAVLAAIVILPLRTSHEKILTGLTVEVVGATDDGTRSADPASPSAGVLRNGDAFVLSFALQDDSYLAVVHVDPRGKVALVHPQEQSRVARLDGGRRHLLPDPGDDEMWVLGGATGRESFVIATDRETAPSLSELRASIADRTRGLDRTAALKVIQELLDADWDQVEIIEFSHVN